MLLASFSQLRKCGFEVPLRPWHALSVRQGRDQVGNRRGTDWDVLHGHGMSLAGKRWKTCRCGGCEFWDILEYPEYLNEFVQVLISELMPQASYHCSRAWLQIQRWPSWTSFVWVHCKALRCGEPKGFDSHFTKQSAVSRVTFLVAGSNRRRNPDISTGDINLGPVATVVCHVVCHVVCERVDVHYHSKPQRPNIFISSSSQRPAQDLNVSSSTSSTQ